MNSNFKVQDKIDYNYLKIKHIKAQLKKKQKSIFSVKHLPNELPTW